MVLVCGRSEGVDERVIEAHALEEISVGDFVLSGGEIAAMAVMDCCVRLLPGVMGAAAVGETRRVSRTDCWSTRTTRGPRPGPGPDGTERRVPEVLVSGHHGKVAEWRMQAAGRDHAAAAARSVGRRRTAKVNEEK